MFDAIHFMIIKSPLIFTLLAIISGFLAFMTAGALGDLPSNDEDRPTIIKICIVTFFTCIGIVYFGQFYEPSYF